MTFNTPPPKPPLTGEYEDFLTWLEDVKEWWKIKVAETAGKVTEADPFHDWGSNKMAWSNRRSGRPKPPHRNCDC